MKSSIRLALLTLAVSAGAALAQLNPGDPLSGLEKLKNFETKRASSSDRDWKNGNMDWREIEPGGTLTLAHLTGPGQIVHIWCAAGDHEAFYPRLLTLRMYWDDEQHPSVECPIGDFFAMGHGVDRDVSSLPVRVTAHGTARNCYWPMPFRKSARITVSNDGQRRCGSFYYNIDWQKYPSLPEDTAYFCAMYRQEFPCMMGRNYLIADIEGRGHYVGTVQSVYLVSPGWYGEGNDYFFIDGESKPGLRGTGTEDYFCDSGGFHEQSGPFYGTPLWEGYDTGDRGSAYRWHIPDPITFNKSLRVEIQHKGSQVFPDGTNTVFIERDDLMSSVAFWYQIEPHKAWPALPPGYARLPFSERILLKGHYAVAGAKHSDGTVQVQKLAGAVDDKQLCFLPHDGHASLEVSFQLFKPQTVLLYGKMVHSWDYGIYDVKFDGVPVAHLDLYAADVTLTTQSWGRRPLAAGTHTLRFDGEGKNPRSAGYGLGLDALAARVPVYSRGPDEDLRKLQKPR